jgi:hypothetical protein
MFRKEALKAINPITIALVITFMFALLCYAADQDSDDYYYTYAQLDYWGGKLKGSDIARGTSLIVPEGALTETTTLSMEVWSDRTSYIRFHFEPHGTEFQVPVQLELSWTALKDVSVDDLMLYYWDDEQGKWVEETRAEFNEKTKKATLYLDHFSYYYYGRR